MHVVVMGAGVVGVTTAWQLLEDGHEVTVIDRQPEAACETSFANAGLVAVGHALAWANPRALRTLIRSLIKPDQPLRFRFRADPAFWRFSLAFLRQCTEARARANTRIKHRLCGYAQQVLQQVVAATGVEYDGMRGGILYLHRTPETLERGIANLRILADAGQPMEVVDRERAAAIDPALASDQGQDRRRDLLPDRRERRCRQVLARARRGVRRARRELPVSHHDQRRRRRRRSGRARGDRSRRGARRLLRAGARQLQPADPGPRPSASRSTRSRATR